MTKTFPFRFLSIFFPLFEYDHWVSEDASLLFSRLGLGLALDYLGGLALDYLGGLALDYLGGLDLFGCLDFTQHLADRTLLSRHFLAHHGIPLSLFASSSSRTLLIV